MDPTTYRSHKQLFSHEWPAGADPAMKNYDYFNQRFGLVDGYNWWLLPSVHNGEPKHWCVCSGHVTMKFKLCNDLDDRYKTNERDAGDERIRVLVEHEQNAYYVDVDEESNLYAEDERVGKINILKINMWDGTASLDIEKMHSKYPHLVKDVHFWWNDVE